MAQEDIAAEEGGEESRVDKEAKSGAFVWKRDCTKITDLLRTNGGKLREGSLTIGENVSPHKSRLSSHGVFSVCISWRQKGNVFLFSIAEQYNVSLSSSLFGGKQNQHK